MNCFNKEIWKHGTEKNEKNQLKKMENVVKKFHKKKRIKHLSAMERSKIGFLFCMVAANGVWQQIINCKKKSAGYIYLWQGAPRKYGIKNGITDAGSTADCCPLLTICPRCCPKPAPDMPEMMLLPTSALRISYKDCLLMALSLELFNSAPYVLSEPQMCSEAILWRN